MNLIIMISKNSSGAVTTNVKWGRYKLSWHGKSSLYWALRFCSDWFMIAKRIKIICRGIRDENL